LELNGRTVLLTGASGGIGRAAALRLAGAGARLALFARSEAPLSALAAELAAVGGEAIPIPGDVTRSEDCVRAVEEATRRFGRLDALVNNAGVGYLRTLSEATDEEIDRQIEVNLRGTIRMTRAALPALSARPGSAIVNVASLAARIAPPFYSYYSATKFALAGLTESWRRELRPRGIRVTLLLPTAVETPFLDRAGRDRSLGAGPAGVLLRPEQVGSAIVSALRHNPPDLYVPFWQRGFAWINLMAPGISDRVMNALFRYPR
jgi:NAD(P)-dependent dehydrogenase (short-subunit alcohol dehydrogenase family)